MAIIAWNITQNEIASAIYNGTASKDFAEGFIETFQGKWYNPENITKGVNNFIKKVGDFFDNAGKKIKAGIDFFSNWMRDDPVGATAGAGAVLLTGAVILFVGGAAVGALATAGSTATAGTTAAGGTGIFSGILKIAKGIKTIAVNNGLVRVGLTAFGLGTVIRTVVRGTQYLYNFNWNQTDKEIEEAQKNAFKGLAGIFGQALGSTIGTLVCGTALSAGLKQLKVVKFNPTIMAKLSELEEFDVVNGQYGELYEEAVENVKAALTSLTRVATNAAFMETYKNIRKLIKATSRGLQLEKVFPWLGKLIEKWGEEGSKPWSFAIAVENFTESISNETLRNFTEEAIEGFMESCTESAMLVSYAV